MALIVHKIGRASSSELTLYARARMARSARGSDQGVRWPHRRRADSFAPRRWRLSTSTCTPRARPARPAAAELGGLLRQHPLRRSTETGLLAALAPRLGGSADGADRSQDRKSVE